MAYASKAFTKGELSKATIEKELTAIHFAIKYFKLNIYGNHFTVKSDHKPLTYHFSMKDPTSKLTRMRLNLEEYNFTVVFINGKDNVIADALSHITIEDLKKQHEATIQIIQTRSMSRKTNIHNRNENIELKEGVLKVTKSHEGKITRGIPMLKINHENGHNMKIKDRFKNKQIINLYASILTNADFALEEILVMFGKEAD